MYGKSPCARIKCDPCGISCEGDIDMVFSPGEDIECTDPASEYDPPSERGRFGRPDGWEARAAAVVTADCSMVPV